jgi:hypothetical protein
MPAPAGSTTFEPEEQYYVRRSHRQRSEQRQWRPLDHECAGSVGVQHLPDAVDDRVEEPGPVLAARYQPVHLAAGAVLAARADAEHEYRPVDPDQRPADQPDGDRDRLYRSDGAGLGRQFRARRHRFRPAQLHPAPAAKAVTINILNSSGQTIAQIPGSTDSGSNSVSYNGTYPGQPTLPAGQYSFSVTAVDASGTALQATLSTTGVVTGVDNTNGVVNLHLGNLVIPESSVTQIIQPSSSSSSS